MTQTLTNSDENELLITNEYNPAVELIDELAAILSEKTATLSNSLPVSTPFKAREASSKNQKETEDDTSERSNKLDSIAKNSAARVIQRAWRGHKVKETIVNNPYTAYLSLIDPNDEEKLMLSALMFGRHVAEIRKQSNEHIPNPFIPASGLYHRSDTHEGEVMKLFCERFNEEMMDYNIYLPIALSRNLAIDSILDKFPDSDIELKMVEEGNLGVLIIRKDEDAESLKQYIASAGLIASPWEIAEFIKGEIPKPEQINSKNLPADLPTTKSDLLRSRVFLKLSGTAEKSKYPTQFLAQSLSNLIENLPDNLNAQSIRRIALMLDLVNTFYRYNYPRYAFFVYMIVHEMSLEFSLNQTPAEMEHSFDLFTQSTTKTMTDSLTLGEQELDAVQIVHSSALSGSNAYYLAQTLAEKMQSYADKQLYYPVDLYYETQAIITNAENAADANIFIITPGAVMQNTGLTLGTDPNKFVEEYIIRPDRKDPVVLILDTTSALYKDLALNDHVKKLISEGQLSIIVFESLQKFGLLHTDQAQAGRMVAYCSKKHFLSDDLALWEQNTRQDFKQHVDMRIAAYLHSYCADLIEKIKERQFDNGKIFHDILAADLLWEVVNHQKSELELKSLPYFLVWQPMGMDDALPFNGKLVEDRDSFGHYHSSVTSISSVYGTIVRLSPGASDALDSLIQSTQIYLAHKVSASNKHIYNTLLQELSQQSSLPIEKEIIILAAAANLIFNHHKDITKDDFPTINRALSQCVSLKGRDVYTKVIQELKNVKTLFSRLEGLSETLLNKWQVTKETSSRLLKSKEDHYLLHKLDGASLKLDEHFFTTLVNNPVQIDLIKNRLDNLTNESQKLFSWFNDIGVDITPDKLIRLLDNDDDRLSNLLNNLVDQECKSKELYNFLLTAEYPVILKIAMFTSYSMVPMTEQRANALISLEKLTNSFESYFRGLENDQFCNHVALFNQTMSDFKNLKDNTALKTFADKYFNLLNNYYSPGKTNDEKSASLAQLQEVVQDYIKEANPVEKMRAKKLFQQAQSIINPALGASKSTSTFFSRTEPEVEKASPEDPKIQKSDRSRV
jgi:hypothetical protein